MNSEHTLVVIAYESDSAASAARERLLSLSAEDTVDLEVAAFVTKDMSGEVKIDEPRGHAGLLRIFGMSKDSPDAHHEVVQASAEALGPGEFALCLLVRSVSPEKVIPALSSYGGTVVKTSLAPDREQLLKEAIAKQWSAEQVSAELDR